MNTSLNTAWALGKLQLRRLAPAYIATGAVVSANLAQSIVFLFLPASMDNSNLTTGNLVFLLPLLAAILIPTRNLRKSMNLGAHRVDFFWGCIPVYAILAAGSALFSVLWHVIIDSLLLSSGKFDSLIDMADVFGFYKYGPVVAFLQLFAFLLLVEAFVHTLTMAQTAWYGWVADVVIISIISVFTPIAPLRAAETWFFHLVIFSNVFVQIGVSLGLAAVLYAISLSILNRKKV